MTCDYEWHYESCSGMNFRKQCVWEYVIHGEGYIYENPDTLTQFFVSLDEFYSWDKYDEWGAC